MTGDVRKNVAGVVLAGGKSSRFGRDKAAEMLLGRTLLDWAVAALSPHCEPVFVSGRKSEHYLSISDWPRSGLGPLGGLAGALMAARKYDCELLVSIPCDTPRLPDRLIESLLEQGGPCYVESCPVIGVWPVVLSRSINQFLENPNVRRSVRGWAESISALPMYKNVTINNINFQNDLSELGFTK